MKAVKRGEEPCVLKEVSNLRARACSQRHAIFLCMHLPKSRSSHLETVKGVPWTDSSSRGSATQW
eukprot:scaffold204266_cov19-Tisochrysis_lutea.AAC.1